MPQHYDETFKKQIVRLRLEEGRSIRSIIEEYGMSKASIINWCNEFREECQNNPDDQETGKFFFATGNIYHSKLCGYDAAAGKLVTYCDSGNFSPGFDGAPAFVALQDGTLLLNFEQGREGEQGFKAYRYKIFWDAKANWMGYADAGADWGSIAREIQSP